MTTNPRQIKSSGGGGGATVLHSDTIPTTTLVSGQTFTQPITTLNTGATFTTPTGSTLITEKLTTTGATLNSTGGAVKSSDLHQSHDLSARFVTGDTSGTVVPAGYIGQMVHNLSWNTVALNNATYVMPVSFTLLPGIYDISVQTMATSIVNAIGQQIVLDVTAHPTVTTNNPIEYGGTFPTQSTTFCSVAFIIPALLVTTSQPYWLKIVVQGGSATANSSGFLKVIRRA